MGKSNVSAHSAVVAPRGQADCGKRPTPTAPDTSLAPAPAIGRLGALFLPMDAAPSPVSRAVFLSYASQDAEAARRICEALRAAGIEVWFDQSELRGGDQWDAKIRGQIAACALFVPIVSTHTQARLEGYFRIEWKLAAQRTHAMADEKAFVLPVVIDDTREVDARVPAEFKVVQWTRLPAAEGAGKFCARVNALLDGLPEAGISLRQQRGEGGARAVNAGPRWRRAFAGLLVAAVLILALFVWQPWRPAAVSSAVNDRSIAVLPFTNMSAEKDNAFFADGVHEDLLTNLANLSALKVVSRTSVMQYRDPKKSVAQIARELGVAYVLEGSVRRAGDKIRVTGQLIKAATDEHRWGKNYDRDLKDVFAVQAELARDIASALNAAITGAESAGLEARPTQNLDAYDCFQKARVLGCLGRARPAPPHPLRD